jgi:hypothetical protein
MVIAGHFHQRIIAYPVARAAGLLTNWICQMTVTEAAPPREDWNRRVAKDKVLAAFGGWRFPWLDLPTLIEQSPDIYEFPLVDRDPASAWTKPGRFSRSSITYGALDDDHEARHRRRPGAPHRDVPATFVLEKYRPHWPLKVGIAAAIPARCPAP